SAPARFCTLSDGGGHLAIAGPTGLTLVDLAGAQSARALGDQPALMHAPKLSSDGSKVAWFADATGVHVWDPAANKPVCPPLPGKNVRCLAFGPDGSRLAIGGFEDARDTGFVKVWDCRTARELATLRGHSNPLTGLAFSPDSRRLATASADRTVMV